MNKLELNEKIEQHIQDKINTIFERLINAI